MGTSKRQSRKVNEKQRPERDGEAENIAALGEAVSRFAEKEIVPRIEEIDHYPDKPFPADLVGSAADLGLLSIVLPEEMDGIGAGMRVLGAVLETLSEKAAGIAASILVHTLAQGVVLSLGAKEARDGRIRPAAGARPRLLAIGAYTSPREWATGISAVEEKGGYRLNGREEYVPNAPIADAVIVKAVVKEGKEKKLALFFVGKEQAGLDLGAPVLSLGLRSCPVSDVTLESAKVEASSLVWIGGDAAELDAVFERFQGPCASIAAGILGGALATAIGYAKERYQGGKQIIDHGQIRMMIAGMTLDHETVRLVSIALGEAAGGGGAMGKAAFARARDSAVRGTIDGVQVLGGYGYMEDYGQERRMRDARQLACLFGRGPILQLEAASRRIEGEA